MNSHAAAALFVRNWYARCPEMFDGVNCHALISHLAKVHAAGGVVGLTNETGLKRLAVIQFLSTAL